MWTNSVINRLMHKVRVFLIATFLLSLMLLSIMACSACDDDSSDDDDMTPADDDTTDDDTADDDSIDDDTTPPAQQAVANTTPFLEQLTVVDEDNLKIEMIAGGCPGHNGTSLAAMPDGSFALAAVKGRSLFVYHVQIQGTTTKELVAHYATSPTIAVDGDGALHVLFINNEDPDNERLVYGNNRNGNWLFETVAAFDDDAPLVDPVLRLAVDSAGHAHFVYIEVTTSRSLQGVGKYGTNASGSWIVENVVEGETINYDTISLAIDSQNVAHVVYAFDGQVVYASRRDGNVLYNRYRLDSVRC